MKKDSQKGKPNAGYGEQTITPRLGIELTGYGFYLNRLAKSVADDLKVRVLFLESDGVRIVLISCDLLSFSVVYSDSVRKKIAERFGIPAQNVLLTCTHTHSSPATQSLLGIGEVDPQYVHRVGEAILEAVGVAEANMDESEFVYAFEAVEPIGFNRRTRTFEGIDPWLKVGVFRRALEKIYLLSYACHPVVLGRNEAISADWPGALIREMENAGHRALFFQGFCGDIDPVTNLNRWGEGDVDDLQLYGKILSERAFEAEAHAVFQRSVPLAAVEKRIDLPLDVYLKDAIQSEADRFLKSHGDYPSSERFIGAWKRMALEKHAEFQEKPFIDNIPIQVVSIGRLKMIGLPGEVFCGIGLRLQEAYRPVIPVGLANGNVGYLPTKSTYEKPDDYACSCAPKISSVFPFSRETETLLVRESCSLLDTIQES